MDPSAPPSHSMFNTSFPILAISILGILTTAILLLSYYIFVTKCCLNLNRSDILLFRLSSISRSRRFRHQFNPQNLRTTTESRGLDTSTINSIPTVRFVRSTNSSIECSVCLTDFQEQEFVRLLPVCSHSFHIDCVDTWLQSNANCPLCRTQVGLRPVLQKQFNAATTAATETRQPEQDSSNVVIDIIENMKAPRRFSKMMSMGDECIDIARDKDERFVVNTIRRSFSMDSSNDRHLYVSVQEILKQNRNFLKEASDGEGSSSGNGGNVSGRMKRLFSSFGRTSRTASVLPL